MKNRVLVVEDSESLRDVLVTVLNNEGFEARGCASAEDALVLLESNGWSCILSDFRLPGMNGIELLSATRKVLPSVPFVIMTAYGSIDIAVLAMKEGANDFITKPFEPPILSNLLRQVIQHKQIIDRSSVPKVNRPKCIVTNNPRLLKILDQAQQVAQVDASVLILGESGTGKELLARYIHDSSPRKDKPFIAINCAAMPPELLESEFFGHEAGAFTGATQTRIGMFEAASEGTIFLDEIGEMQPFLQVKLLRALQEREIRRVGASRSIKVNPRVLAATNKEIEPAIVGGELRGDLYYRLAVVTFTLPPLKDRIEDIPALVRHFTDRLGSEMGQEGLRVSADALDFLEHYTWPGNVRELENVIERAVVLADNEIRPEHLGITVQLNVSALQEASTTLGEIASRAAEKAEREVIEQVLKQTRGNKSRAAEILGVSYKTLLNKVKQYRLGAGDEEQVSGS